VAGLVGGEHLEHSVALRPHVLRQVADPAVHALELVQVAEEIAHRARVKVLLGTHAERALGFVVVPGEHVAAALAAERHREQQHGTVLPRRPWVDHGDLAHSPPK
jgi:hypothetical protein